jgi:hypothetical protein
MKKKNGWLDGSASSWPDITQGLRLGNATFPHDFHQRVVRLQNRFEWSNPEISTTNIVDEF